MKILNAVCVWCFFLTPKCCQANSDGMVAQETGDANSSLGLEGAVWICGPGKVGASKAKSASCLLKGKESPGAHFQP